MVTAPQRALARAVPENQTSASPPPIQARSRSRLTMAVYTRGPGRAPQLHEVERSFLGSDSKGTTKMTFCTRRAEAAR